MKHLYGVLATVARHRVAGTDWWAKRSRTNLHWRAEGPSVDVPPYLTVPFRIGGERFLWEYQFCTPITVGSCQNADGQARTRNACPRCGVDDARKCRGRRERVGPEVTVRAVAAVPRLQTGPVVILEHRGAGASCACWFGGPGEWGLWESRTGGVRDAIPTLWSRGDVGVHSLVAAGSSPRMRATVRFTHSGILEYWVTGGTGTGGRVREKRTGLEEEG
jgi:hypothetical protein